MWPDTFANIVAWIIGSLGLTGVIIGSVLGVREGVKEVLPSYGGSLRAARARMREERLGTRIFFWYELIADSFGWAIALGIVGGIAGVLVGLCFVPVAFLLSLVG